MIKLKPRHLRSKRPVPAYTVLRCVMAGHQVSFCRHLCTPVYGKGACGRWASHGLRGRTQRAIDRRLAMWAQRDDAGGSDK